MILLYAHVHTCIHRSLQSRVESALSTAEKLWKEQHLSELSKLQQQLQKAKTSSPSHSPSIPSEAGQSGQGGGAGVDAALKQAREQWEREHEVKVEEAIGLAKQVHCN